MFLKTFFNEEIIPFQNIDTQLNSLITSKYNMSPGWWTGRPGVLRFMGSQKVAHDWATDLIWSDLIDVLGTMLPAGPTKMNKDLNSKFCFQKQMSCSRTWTKKWGRVRTQYNGYYSKTKTQKITSVGEDTEILEPLCIASKNVEWSSCYTKQFGGSSQN